MQNWNCCAKAVPRGIILSWSFILAGTIGLRSASIVNPAETCTTIVGDIEHASWPQNALRAQTDRPECARNGATRLGALDAGLLSRKDCTHNRAAQGETIYFPSQHWHVGMSPDLSVALDLALFGVGRSS